MSQAAGQGTQIPPQLSQMTRGGADFSGSQQMAHQMAGHFQSTAIVVPAKTEGQRSVSFAAFPAPILMIKWHQQEEQQM